MVIVGQLRLASLAKCVSVLTRVWNPDSGSSLALDFNQTCDLSNYGSYESYDLTNWTNTIYVISNHLRLPTTVDNPDGQSVAEVA